MLKILPGWNAAIGRRDRLLLECLLNALCHLLLQHLAYAWARAGELGFVQDAHLLSWILVVLRTRSMVHNVDGTVAFICWKSTCTASYG